MREQDSPLTLKASTSQKNGVNSSPYQNKFDEWGSLGLELVVFCAYGSPARRVREEVWERSTIDGLVSPRIAYLRLLSPP